MSEQKQHYNVHVPVYYKFMRDPSSSGRRIITRAGDESLVLRAHFYGRVFLSCRFFSSSARSFSCANIAIVISKEVRAADDDDRHAPAVFFTSSLGYTASVGTRVR